MIRYALLFAALMTVAGAEELPNEKIDSFIAQVSEACRNEDYAALNVLHGSVRVSDIILDEAIESWHGLLYRRTFDSVEFMSLKQSATKISNIAYILRQMVGPKWMNGSSYSPNIPVVGFLYVYTKPKGTGMSAMYPVGMDPSGVLRFVLRAKDKEANQALEPTSTAVTPPADAGDRASGTRGSS